MMNQPVKVSNNKPSEKQHFYLCPPLAVFVCDVLMPPEHGSLELSNGVQLDSVAFYECDDDFVMFSGDGIRTCVNSGWTGMQPLCERKSTIVGLLPLIARICEFIYCMQKLKQSRTRLCGDDAV